MAIYRDPMTGKIDRQEFENHLKAATRREGYIEIVMFTPDPYVQISSVITEDILDMCDITAITDLDRYTSTTIATLEENAWLLDGRYIVYQGGSIDGYISKSISDENGEFETNPRMKVQLTHSYSLEDFSIVLNAATPSGYPKSIKIGCYNSQNTLLSEQVVNIEWQEPTGEVDEEGEPIFRTKLLETLPSVNFSLDTDSVSYLVIEYIGTRFRHRRIRVSSIMFGKTVVLNQNDITNVDYIDKTSYACDTLPSRVFTFDVNNYDSIYNIDNPENSLVKLNKQTRIRFRCGYNVWGYSYDENGKVIMQDGKPIVDMEQEGVEIEWDNWKELRLMDISVTAEETATFTAGSLLDIMDDTYTEEYYPGASRPIEEIAGRILVFEGLDSNSIEWSTDGIKKPLYIQGKLQPYESWEDTSYAAYEINVPVPEASCKQIIQYLAFAVGATILIKDDGHIKFANLNINDPDSFTDHYTWDYRDFIDIPVAEQLPSINYFSDISLPKYYATIDRSGEEMIIVNGVQYTDCTVIATMTCTAMAVEVTYSDCMPIGVRMADDDRSWASISSSKLYTHRGLIRLGGYVAGTEAKVELLGYPVITKSIQERTLTSNSLVLDTKVMKSDPSNYEEDGSVKYTEQIKRKYLQWYKKKFKYKIGTRGEPLVNAGNYAIIQTQFTEQLPVYILQNHWTFDGAWEGDMEVIALE